MPKRLLVTTALQDTWGEAEPVVFLGEWCKLFREKDKWSALDHEVIGYPWDDRKRLYEDYQYIASFYERVLAALTRKLNEVHGTSFNIDYWRIILGPWLLFFIQIIFERWIQIKKAEERSDISGTVILETDTDKYIPSVGLGFSSLVLSDEWNHFVYGFIIKNFTTIPYTTRQGNSDFKAAHIVAPISESKIKKILFWCLQRFNRNKQVLIVDLVLSKRNMFSLLLKHGYLVNSIRQDSGEEIAAKKENRQWKPLFNGENDFENCLLALLPLSMPAVYLEGYKNMAAVAAGLFPSVKPDLIITSYIYFTERLKFYIARKMNEGTKLVIVQHGGSYGVMKWFVNEDLELKVANYFFSWGWTLEGSEKVIPSRMLNRNDYVARSVYDQPNLMFIMTSGVRYSYKLASEPVSKQWLQGIEDQVAFTKRLPAHIRNVLIVKPYPADFGWNDVSRLTDSCPGVTIAGSGENNKTLSAKSRIVVIVNNSTTLLEALSKNIPTIVYWDPYYWELKDTAVPYFDELKAVGIFHESGISAADKIAEVWDKVEEWWLDADLQNTVKKFTDHTAKVGNDNLKEFVRNIKQALA